MVVEHKINLKYLLKDTFKSFFNHITLYLVLISVIGGITYYVKEKTYVPKYTSAVTFIVKPSTSVTADNLGSNYAIISQISKSFPYIIMNDAMRDIIKSETNTVINKEDLSVESLADTNSFTVTVANEDKQLSFDILNTIIKNYSKIGEKVIGDTYINIISEINTLEDPINKNISKYYAIGAIIIITIIMFCFFIFYAYNKKSIIDKKDLQNKLNLSCLSSIPLVKKFNKNSLLITDKRTPYIVKEQIKKLRIKVEGWNRELGSKVFLVTSSLADEGKSTISINLGLELQEKGYKTLIVDFDFRNPSILNILGYEKDKVKIGLYDLYEGKITNIDNIIFKDDNTNLDIITSGDVSKHSIKSLINIEKLNDIFNNLRDRYDYIILDTSPSSILSDSSDLSYLADYGIYIVRCDYAPLSVIEDGLDLLSDTGLKFMGCVLNYSKDKHIRYYKYYRRKGKSNE